MKTIKITEEQMGSILENLKNYWLMKNASPSEEDDGSMISYWEQQTGKDLSECTFECPKCRKEFGRKELDGAHVVIASNGNHPQYITPLCQHCNRERDDKPFLVLKENVIPAP